MRSRMPAVYRRKYPSRFDMATIKWGEKTLKELSNFVIEICDNTNRFADEVNKSLENVFQQDYGPEGDPH